MRSNYTEHFISSPWGKIAVISYGDPKNEPILMVHGRQDSAATFIPLVELLPKTFYYVAVDLPGHGKSDPYPKGIVLSRFHYVHTIHIVVKYMGWKTFIFIGHSMGCEMVTLEGGHVHHVTDPEEINEQIQTFLGLFYNAASPGIMTKAVLLDTGPTFQRLDQSDHQLYYKMCYQKYYDNYQMYNGPNKLYTKREAVEALMKARGVTDAQAQLLLSRNLVRADGDRYRLAWDSRNKWAAPQNMTKDYYLTLFTSNMPPTLFICMTNGRDGYPHGAELADFLIENMLKGIVHARKVTLEGGHDHHVTNPEEINEHVQTFLHENFVKSKL